MGTRKAWQGTTVIVIRFSVLAYGIVVVGTVIAVGTAESSAVALTVAGKASAVVLESLDSLGWESSFVGIPLYLHLPLAFVAAEVMAIALVGCSDVRLVERA